MQKIWKSFVILLFCLCLSLNIHNVHTISAFSDESEVKIPILMYHKVSERQKSWGKYCISPEELENDIKLIISRGFTPIFISDLEKVEHGEGVLPEKPIIITFDDGHRSDFVYVFPLAKKYNIKFVSSPVASYVEDASNSTDHNINYAYLCWDELKEMEKSGLVEFQNHSYNLHNFNSTRKGCLKSKSETDSDYKALVLSDFEKSQALFEENNIKKPTCFTYPYGMRDDLLLECVKNAGFSSSLGTYARINNIKGDLYDLCRFNRPHNYNINGILDLAE